MPTHLEAFGAVAVSGSQVVDTDHLVLYALTLGSTSGPRAIRFSGFSDVTIAGVTFGPASGALYVQSEDSGLARVSPDLTSCTVLASESSSDAIVDGYVYYSTGDFLKRVPK